MLRCGPLGRGRSLRQGGPDLVLQPVRLGAEDGLDVVADLDHARCTQRPQRSGVHGSLVHHLDPQPGDAGIDGLEVVRAAEGGNEPVRPRGRSVRIGDVVGAGHRPIRVVQPRVASRGEQVPPGDREAEQRVVEEEEHHTHHDQQRDVLRRRGRAVEEQVDQAGREREAEVDVEGVRQGQGEAGEHRVDHVEGEGDEHERELEGLGDAGEEGRQPGGGEDADGQLLLVGARHVDHRECGSGEAEHQDRVEAGGQAAGLGVTVGEAGELTGVGGAVGGELAVEEPDVGVDDVVQAERDQHPVDESVHERTDRTRSTDELGDAGETHVEEGVEVAETEPDEERRQRDHDGHEPSAAEEAEVGRQLDRVVAVEEPRRHHSDDDAGEDAVVDHRLVTARGGLPCEHDRRHGLEDLRDDEVARHGRQGRRSVRLAGEADGHTDREQQRQVGEDRAAGSAHRVEEGADDRRVVLAEQVLLPEAKQDSCRRQQRDGEHQALAEALELGEARDAQAASSRLGVDGSGGCHRILRLRRLV